jgi:hypothetical protein
MEGKMLGWLAFYVGITAVVFAIVYWQHDRDQRFKREVYDRLQALDFRDKQLQIKLDGKVEAVYGRDVLENWLKDIENCQDEIRRTITHEMNHAIDVSAKNVDEIARHQKKMIDDLQKHCAKLRESQMDLQDQLSKKRPLVKLAPGPIQLEIYTPKTNLGRKKKQK